MFGQRWLTSKFSSLQDISVLDQGAQKHVFSAQHQDHGNVVLKLIRSGHTPERTQRELLAAKQIDSRRIPRIFEHSIIAGPAGEHIVWVIEQRIQGMNLQSVLKGRPLSLLESNRLAVQLLEVLERAEQARIVHRDIKPANIMLDTAGEFWLLDFGLARHLDLNSLTATAQTFGVGTPGYAPPEQYRNIKGEIDSRADLFALGVTIYECLTQRNPFTDGVRDVGEVVRRIEGNERPTLSLPEDPNGIAADFVATLMQRRANHRPSTAAEALIWARELAGGTAA